MVKSKSLLKIGFVLDGGIEKPDGVQQYILQLGSYFSSKGHTVRYIVAGNIPSTINGAISFAKSIKVESNGNELKIPLPASKKLIKQYLSSEKFDVLHIQVPYSPFMGEKVIKCADKSTAIVGTYHIVPNNWLLNIGNWLLGKWCYFSLKKFDQMISVSPAAARIAKRDFGKDSVILPNVVNFLKYHNAVAVKDRRKLTILFLGRLVPRKGCQQLLNAITALISESKGLPNFQVLIGGSGPLEEKLKKYVNDNGLEKIVSFIGYVNEEDKPKIYASSDIAIFPATGGESFGIVLIEALSSGRPVVLAGNNEGYKSVMKDQPSLLFNPNNTNEIVQILKKYLKNSKARKDIATWGGEYAKRFDVRKVGDQILSVYTDSLLKKPKDKII